jgi:hypothetical protein
MRLLWMLLVLTLLECTCAFMCLPAPTCCTRFHSQIDHDAETEAASEEEAAAEPTGPCPAFAKCDGKWRSKGCDGNGKVLSCDTQLQHYNLTSTTFAACFACAGKVIGGLGALPGLGWLPIKVRGIQCCKSNSFQVLELE